MKYSFLFLVIIFIGLSACISIKDGKPTIKQGVYGKVVWQEGNQMPSPDAPAQSGGNPIVRKIRIYQLTAANQVTGNAPLYTGNRAVLVAETTTNTAGYFQCKLKSGWYSIFTVEPEDQLFANISNGKGEIAGFEVKEGKLTNYDIKINYKAVF